MAGRGVNVYNTVWGGGLGVSQHLRAQSCGSCLKFCTPGGASQRTDYSVVPVGAMKAMKAAIKHALLAVRMAC